MNCESSAGETNKLSKINLKKYIVYSLFNKTLKHNEKTQVTVKQ
jgi:hypothetical protein